MTRGRVLHAGDGVGPVLRLDDALSFWGGLDPATGTIIDRAHPQVGESIAGAIVAMPGSRGSSGTPGVLGEALRRGVGPAAIIVTKPDVNLLAGAIVAGALYDVPCPIVLVTIDEFAALRTGDRVSIAAGGEIRDEGRRPESDPTAAV